MTATNHALSGAVIGLTITQPVIALPLALISHFVLDAIPHFGIEYYKNNQKRRLFHASLLIDAFLLVVIFATLFLLGANWLVFACAFLAGCPDFFQAYKYFFDKQFHKTGRFTSNNRYSRFIKGIQRESEKGIFIEITFAAFFSIIIANNL